ncbi:hypothetical protein FM036_43910 [Nostoc sp. HG1]|nr:hypothetical protein [Nostoc sp. HG1]
MNNLEQQIRSKLNEKSMSLKDFIGQVGFTEQAYYKMIRLNSTTDDRIEKINSVLGLKLKKVKYVEIVDENEAKKVETILNHEENTPFHGFDWKEERKGMIEKINILTNTIRELSLGKFEVLLCA